MIHPTHDEARLALLADERRVLRAVEAQLGALGADDALARTLADSVAQLDEGFLLVLVGEFNAGKSAFINALIGWPLLEEGVTPTTSRIARVRFSEQPTRAPGERRGRDDRRARRDPAHDHDRGHAGHERGPAPARER